MSEFIQAAKMGNLSLVQKLVSHTSDGCDVNMTQGEENYSALYWAACCGHAHVVGFLLNQGANINQAVTWGSTALHAASERGHRDCVFYLTRWNCDVNAQNLNHLDTPLHLAAYRGHLQVCQDLLRHGADIHITNRQSKTPLDEAQSQGQHQVYELLLRQIQDPTMTYNANLRRCSSFDTQWSINGNQHQSSASAPSQHTDRVMKSHPYPSDDMSSMNSLAATIAQKPPLQDVNDWQKEKTTMKYRRELPGNWQCFQDTVTDVNIDTSGDRRGSQLYHQEVYYNNDSYSGNNLLSNEYQGQNEFEVDGSTCDSRNKIPSEHSSQTTVYSSSPQGSSDRLYNQTLSTSLSYFKASTRYDISPDSTKVIAEKSSPSQHTYEPNVPIAQIKALHHRVTNSQIPENHTELLNALQLQIAKKRDEVELLKRKNTELWFQCEKYKNTKDENSKLLVICNERYQQCLVENQRLQKKLKETETKTKAAIVKLMKQYKKSPSQSSSISSSDTPISFIARGPLPYTQSMANSEDLINLEEKTSECSASSSSSKDLCRFDENTSQFSITGTSSSSKDVKSPPSEAVVLQSSEISGNLEGRVPQQCSDESDGISIHKGAPDSPASSGSSQSSDPFTSKMIQSYTANCTDHKQLFSAILPVFQTMDSSLQSSMSESLRTQLQKKISSSSFCVNSLHEEPGREWLCGIDYTLLDENPINRHQQNEGSSSLVFRIQHGAKVYILKMQINSLDLSQAGHGAGQSLPQFLVQQFSVEHDIQLSLSPHPNVAMVLHHYHGSNRQFKRHMSTIISPEIKDTSVEIASQTTFLVMPLYPTTLVRLFKETITDVEEATSAIPEVFVLQKMYDVLSAIQHLEAHQVVHRDIRADNVFLDHELQAVIGDFGYARRFRGVSGESIPFVDRSQILAGNCNAWTPELESMNRGGPESLKHQVSLEDIYSTTDSYGVGKMFFNLLCSKSKNQLRSVLTDIPETYSAGLRYIVKALCDSDVKQRLRSVDALVLVGLLLFGPELDEIGCQTDCIIWHQSRMMKLLVQKQASPTRDSCGNSYICTIEESIIINNGILEKSFFCNISGERMWDCFPTYKSLKSRNPVS